MLTSEILSPFSDLEKGIREVLSKLTGFLFLGEVPIGKEAYNVVYITSLLPGNIVRFPFSIQEISIWTDTLQTTPVCFEQISPIEIQICPDDVSRLKRVGDKIILYISHVVAVGDNLWISYGKHLFDFFMTDSEEYRDILLSFLRFYVLGPTLEGAEGVANSSVKDYIKSGVWWNNLLLPTDLVDVTDRIPRIGISLKEGDRLPFDDLLSNEEFLARFAKDFGEAFFDQNPPLHFQVPGQPLTYVFNGKTRAFILFEQILKYHTFLIQVYDIPNKEEFYKRIQSIYEGRPTHTRPFIAGWADLSDTFGGNLEESTTFNVSLLLQDETPQWVFNSSSGYSFDKFSEEKLVLYRFNEKNLFFDFGRFVNLNQGEITPKLYDLEFDNSNAVFNSDPPKKFDQHAANIRPYGHGLLYFDGKFTEKVETPYAFDVPPTFADFGLKLDRYVELADEYRQAVQDSTIIETSTYVPIEIGVAITSYPVSVMGTFRSVIHYDIDPTTKTITTTYETPKGEMGIYRFEDEWAPKFSSKSTDAVNFDETFIGFGGVLTTPKSFFNTGQRFSEANNLSFNDVIHQSFAGSVAVFGSTDSVDSTEQEVIIFPFVELTEGINIAFAEDISVQVQT